MFHKWCNFFNHHFHFPAYSHHPTQTPHLKGSNLLSNSLATAYVLEFQKTIGNMYALRALYQIWIAIFLLQRRNRIAFKESLATQIFCFISISLSEFQLFGVPKLWKCFTWRSFSPLTVTTVTGNSSYFLLPEDSSTLFGTDCH